MTDNLRRRVVETSTTGLEQFSVLHEVRQPEVSYFEDVVWPQQYVLGFQVSMRDQVQVSCFHPVDDLLEKLFDLFLRKIVVLYIVVQFPALSHLHNHEDVGSSVQHLIEFDYVGVVDEL